MNELFNTTKVKDFVALFKEAEEKYDDPQKFLSDVTTYLPLRLYEHYYNGRKYQYHYNRNRIDL